MKKINEINLCIDRDAKRRIADFGRSICIVSCTLFAFILLFCQTACQINYKANAAERAREYALKHTKELSETDRNFIRYNDPEIFSDLIFKSRVPAPTMPTVDGGPNRYDSYSVSSNPSWDYMHTAFIWTLPKAGFSVVVDGSGERDQRGWVPDTIIYKKFIPENTAFSAAHRNAVEFLVNFFPDLKFQEINRARFMDPQVLPTRFILSGPEEFSQEGQVKKWMEYIRSGKGITAKRSQISLVWTSPVNGNKLIVCGTSPADNLVGWSPKKAFILKPAEFEKELVPNKKISVLDPHNEKGELVITPEAQERKIIEMKAPERPKIRH